MALARRALGTRGDVARGRLRSPCHDPAAASHDLRSRGHRSGGTRRAVRPRRRPLLRPPHRGRRTTSIRGRGGGSRRAAHRRGRGARAPRDTRTAPWQAAPTSCGRRRCSPPEPSCTSCSRSSARNSSRNPSPPPGRIGSSGSIDAWRAPPRFALPPTTPTVATRCCSATAASWQWAWPCSARATWTPMCISLTVWDRGPAHGAAGTAIDVATWLRRGRGVTLVQPACDPPVPEAIDPTAGTLRPSLAGDRPGANAPACDLRGGPDRQGDAVRGREGILRAHRRAGADLRGARARRVREGPAAPPSRLPPQDMGRRGLPGPYRRPGGRRVRARPPGGDGARSISSPRGFRGTSRSGSARTWGLSSGIATPSSTDSTSPDRT